MRTAETKDSQQQSIFSLTDHEVFLVTSRSKTGRSGFICTWALPASLLQGTPRILIEVSPLNYTWQLMCESQEFGIQLLALGQEEMLPRFGVKSGTQGDKFDGISLVHQSASTTPLIEGTCGWARCRIWKTWDIGERVLVIGDVVEQSIDPTRKPLTKKSAFAALPREIAAILRQKHEQVAQESISLFQT